MLPDLAELTIKLTPLPSKDDKSKLTTMPRISRINARKMESVEVQESFLWRTRNEKFKYVFSFLKYRVLITLILHPTAIFEDDL